MKASSATYAKASTDEATPRTGRSSARPLHTRIIAEGIALDGPSKHPDPATHAYRKDLADVALARQVIASHYAEPVSRVVSAATVLRDGPSLEATAVGELREGEPFDLLDDSLGWAWGYAGKDRRVGYLPSAVLSR